MTRKPGSRDRILVRAHDLSARRGEHTLWKRQSFTVPAGSALAITGPSGAGKSTLLNCIGLLDTPDGGALEIDGVLTGAMSARLRRTFLRRTVGHLFQKYGLIEAWSVSRNLDVALSGRSRQDRRELRARALGRVGLDGFESRSAFSLSGGERQRVALARLLLKEAAVVVADEPSAALDADNIAVVISVLAELREQGAAIVIATHDEAVAAWCDERLQLGG